MSPSAKMFSCFDNCKVGLTTRSSSLGFFNVEVVDKRIHLDAARPHNSRGLQCLLVTLGFEGDRHSSLSPRASSCEFPRAIRVGLFNELRGSVRPCREQPCRPFRTPSLSARREGHGV